MEHAWEGLAAIAVHDCLRVPAQSQRLQADGASPGELALRPDFFDALQQDMVLWLRRAFEQCGQSHLALHGRPQAFCQGAARCPSPTSPPQATLT